MEDPLSAPANWLPGAGEFWMQATADLVNDDYGRLVTHLENTSVAEARSELRRTWTVDSSFRTMSGSCFAEFPARQHTCLRECSDSLSTKLHPYTLSCVPQPRRRQPHMNLSSDSSERNVSFSITSRIAAQEDGLASAQYGSVPGLGVSEWSLLYADVNGVAVAVEHKFLIDIKIQPEVLAHHSRGVSTPIPVALHVRRASTMVPHHSGPDNDLPSPPLHIVTRDGIFYVSLKLWCVEIHTIREWHADHWLLALADLQGSASLLQANFYMRMVLNYIQYSIYPLRLEAATEEMAVHAHRCVGPHDRHAHSASPKYLTL
ncbi:unnamed protein product [Pleuronectes platessa]|uniref:Uncharacterized protein n=1 Tax=Pleuronectes platessa TaxID=8262 RepID=A0A9N7VTN8_PLEPL|nr:unnamed protein product [Pleuronectes platessa]